jgi:beta-lactamase class A
MYFEYLPTGTSIGLNEKVEFFPGSLLKVPTIMAYLHQKDVNDQSGDPEYEIKDEQIDRRFGSLWRRGGGGRVKENEAIRLGLTESDNTAVNVLHDATTEENFDYVYEGLDIILNLEETTGQPYISVKEYSSILKALYFSSILNKDDSQMVLDYLAKSKFTDKLPAGVPDEVPVAHKIGVYQSLEIPAYSDCGIVYIPKRQYVLCMASRSDEETARNRMREVSEIVYDYVSNVKN